MVRRRHSGLWGLALFGLLAGGCVLSPSIDPDWAALETPEGNERLLYARSRQVEIERNVWVGRAVAVIGASLVATAVGLWHDSEHRHDNGHDVRRAKRRFAWFGGASGGILLGGVGYAGYHEEMWEKWHRLEELQRLELGDAFDEPGIGEPPTPQPVDPETTPPPRPQGRRLYLEEGSPIPAGAGGFEIVVVTGPDDPRLAHIARALSVVRLPLLEGTGPDGKATYVMGWAAVGKALRK